jgi:hypothetical protein
MSDLVEKLRKAADWGEDEFDVLSPQDAAAAADRIEALERELAEAVAVERFCRECGASVAVDPSFMACHCRTMIWPIRNGERG